MKALKLVLLSTISFLFSCRHSADEVKTEEAHFFRHKTNSRYKINLKPNEIIQEFQYYNGVEFYLIKDTLDNQYFIEKH